MLTITIAIAIFSIGVAWGWHRGLTKVVTMPTALLLSLFAGKLCSPFAFRLLSHTDIFPPLLGPLAASVVSRAAFFLLFYLGGRYLVRQLMRKKHFGANPVKQELYGTVISGKDFFTSQVGNAPKFPQALSERSYQRIERVGGAFVGGIGSIIMLSIILSMIGILGDLQEISQRGHGLFISMKRDSDNAVLSMLRGAANPVDDKVFTVFKDYMLVASDPELMERLLNHPGLVRLAENPRIRALSQPVDADPDGIEGLIAQQRAMGIMLNDLGTALRSDDFGRTMNNKQLAAVLSDEDCLLEFTGEFGKVLRDVIDSK